MTSRKKPGVAFWATVGLVVVLAYPISFGPACWINERTGTGGRIIVAAYRPFFSQMLDERSSIRDTLLWYSRLGISRKNHWPITFDDDLFTFDDDLYWWSQGPWHRERPSP
jgi:hypothetical protein